jgi:hypothetical protein
MSHALASRRSFSVCYHSSRDQRSQRQAPRRTAKSGFNSNCLSGDWCRPCRWPGYTTPAPMTGVTNGLGPTRTLPTTTPPSMLSATTLITLPAITGPHMSWVLCAWRRGGSLRASPSTETAFRSRAFPRPTSSSSPNTTSVPVRQTKEPARCRLSLLPCAATSACRPRGIQHYPILGFRCTSTSSSNTAVSSGGR